MDPTKDEVVRDVQWRDDAAGWSIALEIRAAKSPSTARVEIGGSQDMDAPTLRALSGALAKAADTLDDPAATIGTKTT